MRVEWKKNKRGSPFYWMTRVLVVIIEGYKIKRENSFGGKEKWYFEIVHVASKEDATCIDLLFYIKNYLKR